MQFKLTLTSPNGKRGCEWHDLVTMQTELVGIAKMLDALVPGEAIEITRIS